jgi:UDP-3-O-[3-hydroxymyristoyl] glucosamine N-acyltransferase
MSLEINITDLAKMLNGHIEGDFPENIMIRGICSINNYIANKVTFVKSEKYA